MSLIKLQLGSDTPQQNFSKSILKKEEAINPNKTVTYKEAECLNTTFSTGFTHNDKPVIAPILPSLSYQKPINKNENSIMDSVDSGFGSENIIIQECPKPEYKTHLFKENYLGEFKSNTEKALVRHNLQVYSKTEIHDFVSHVISDGTASFVTKDDVQDMLNTLDFVDSTIRSYAMYNIPDNLFPL